MQTQIARRDFVRALGTTLVAFGDGRPHAQASSLAIVGSFTRIEGRDVGGRGISVFRVGQAGWALTQQIQDVDNPSFLCTDSNRRFLYSADGEQRDHASAFVIRHDRGEIHPLNRLPTGARNAVHITVEPSNRFLIVIMNTGVLTVFPLASDGSLREPTDSFRWQRDGSVVESHPHQAVFEPRGRFFIVPDTATGAIHVHHLDRSSGKVSLVRSWTARARAPRHAVFHPSSSTAYVVNEAESSVSVFTFANNAIGRETQAISTLPRHFSGRNTGAEISITSTGRFLYVTNRGHNSICILRVGRDGLLAQEGWAATGGENPRFATLDPSGSTFYAANQASHNIVAFNVNNQSGALSPVGTTAHVGAPTCIAFA